MAISKDYKPDRMVGDDRVAKESFLRASQRIVDDFGVEASTLDMLRGALQMLETYIEVREEVEVIKKTTKEQ